MSDTTEQTQAQDKTTVGNLPSGPFRKQLDHWLAGLAQSSIQGGAVALKGFFGAAGISQLSQTGLGQSVLGGGIPPISVQQAAMIFLAGAAYHFVDYLCANRLPVVA